MSYNLIKYLVLSIVATYASISNAYIEDYEIRTEIEGLQRQIDDLSTDDYASSVIQFNRMYPKGDFHNKWLSYQGYGSSAIIQCDNEGTQDTTLKIKVYSEMAKKDNDTHTVSMSISNRLFTAEKNPEIQLRVDEKTTYEVKGKISHLSYPTFDFKIPFNVIEDAKKGKFLRIKIKTESKISLPQKEDVKWKIHTLKSEKIFKFSLSGFTSSYNRAIKLSKEKSDDEAFFK